MLRAGVCNGFLELTFRWCAQSVCGCCWAFSGADAASYRVFDCQPDCFFLSHSPATEAVSAVRRPQTAAWFKN